MVGKGAKETQAHWVIVQGLRGHEKHMSFFSKWVRKPLDGSRLMRDVFGFSFETITLAFVLKYVMGRAKG